MKKFIVIILLFFISLTNAVEAQIFDQSVKLIPVSEGWASNSVNTVVFRKNSLVSHAGWQYIAFYNADGFVVLGKRKISNPKWILHTTQFKGNAADAHNCISIMVDGDGYLHLSWDHHSNKLNYSKSLAPGSLEMGEIISMTGIAEEKITYPEFYKLANGNLLFLYRDGASGKGNLVLNHYDTKSKTWKQLQNNLIDGEGKRNAYWQVCTDTKGTIHISWVWRESPNVASNHDLCYARSTDGGITWEKSTGEKYNLPINESTAEYAWKIPQNSELINQTSMCADENGSPYIATYWRSQNDSIPQYRIVFNNNGRWVDVDLSFRKTPFSLSGVGTKRIPISRPQLVVYSKKNNKIAALIFRDEERNSKVSAATTTDILSNKWIIKDLTGFSVGSWEPSFDTELWKQKNKLHLFVQKSDQADGEGRSELTPQMVQVLEYNLISDSKK
jgi:hypothetical protein